MAVCISTQTAALLKWASFCIDLSQPDLFFITKGYIYSLQKTQRIQKGPKENFRLPHHIEARPFGICCNKLGIILSVLHNRFLQLKF